MKFFNLDGASLGLHQVTYFDHVARKAYTADGREWLLRPADAALLAEWMRDNAAGGGARSRSVYAEEDDQAGG